MSEYKIDYEAMIQQLENHAYLHVLTSLCPDKSSADQIVEIMGVFVHNGVSIETAIKIIKELDPILTPKGEKKEKGDV